LTFQTNNFEKIKIVKTNLIIAKPKKGIILVTFESIFVIFFDLWPKKFKSPCGCSSIHLAHKIETKTMIPSYFGIL
jgi:hypothetical protein